MNRTENANEDTRQDWNRSVIPIERLSHLQAGLIALVISIAGHFALIPTISSQIDNLEKPDPESFWAFAILIRFASSTFYTFLLFKLFSPRWSHLKHLVNAPPVWFFWGIGAFEVCFVMFAFQKLDSSCFLYFFGSIAAVLILRASNNEAQVPFTALTEGDEDRAEFESWLESDDVSKHDYIDTFSIVDRIEKLLQTGTRSIGLAGPFGCGKTTVVDELDKRLKESDSISFIVVKKSCWGFANSSTSIHEILADALSQIELEIDTFLVSSLPESYRQTFSAGGKWIDKLANVLLGSPTVFDKFARLSNLLKVIGRDLLVVVEDLDRTDSKSFDLPEMLGFLQTLKEYDNLHFIMTGSIDSSSELSFSNLCDHMEFFPPLNRKRHIDPLISKVLKKCLDPKEFSFFDYNGRTLVPAKHVRKNILVKSNVENISWKISLVIKTVRELRHVLSLTLDSWKRLAGEINLEQLLLMNALRFSAPDYFAFLVSNYNQLRRSPNSDELDETGSMKDKRIENEWGRLVERNGHFISSGVMIILLSLLPTARRWFGEVANASASSAKQVISEEVYFERAVRLENPKGIVGDQQIIEDLTDWNQQQTAHSKLIERICNEENYSTRLEQLFRYAFNNSVDLTEAISTNYFSRSLSQQGPAASNESDGYESIRIICQRFQIESNFEIWLKEMLSQAMNFSLEMVNELNNAWTSRLTTNENDESSRKTIRQFIIDKFRSCINSGDTLDLRLHPDKSETLYQLVNDIRSPAPCLNEIDDWDWLGPIMLEGIAIESAPVIRNVIVLLGAGVGAHAVPNVSTTAITKFFGDQASLVVKTIANFKDLGDVENKVVENVVTASQKIVQESNEENGNR